MPSNKRHDNSSRPKAGSSSGHRTARAARAPRVLVWFALTLALAGGVAALLWARSPAHQQARAAAPSGAAASAATSPSAAPAASLPLPSSEVAQALMVTVELEFGGKLPSIKEALGEVERRHEPADGQGRTFAVLDAYGEPTPAGKLHLSMHVSMEKPGIGSLIFRRTGEVLWKSRIVPGKTTPAAEKSLTVLMEDAAGKSLQLDGSRGISRILDIPLRDSTALVRDVWPEGQERELTFIYSACGCPVKAKVQRNGEATVRTTDLPVMFPDDPAAMTVINQMMGWPGGD